jgi:hypothetical protein
VVSTDRWQVGTEVGQALRGETMKLELKNIKLVEPDPDLFKFPDGYPLADEHNP